MPFFYACHTWRTSILQVRLILLKGGARKRAIKAQNFHFSFSVIARATVSAREIRENSNSSGYPRSPRYTTVIPPSTVSA